MKRGPYKKYIEDGIPKSTYYSRLKKVRKLRVDEVQNADELQSESSHQSPDNSAVIDDEIIDKQHNVSEASHSAMSESDEDNDDTSSDTEEYNENQSENSEEDENTAEHDNNEYGFEEIIYDNHQERGPLLYEFCRLTLQESQLLIMSFIIRHNITDAGLEDLLSLINCHLPTKVYKSKYLFLKNFPTAANIVTHFYCIDCFTLLDFAGKNINTECPDCHKKYNEKILLHDGKFFIQLPLKEQLSNIVNSSYNKFQKTTNDTNYISDICSGNMYNSLKCKNKISNLDITLQWNTDGVQVFKSSKVSIWPIQVMINELPYRERRNSIILCGLWYGTVKPNMQLFLKPFVDDLRDLHYNGITFIPSDQADSITMKVHTLVSPIDSVARPVVQYISQYNGKFGCGLCLNKGERIRVGKGYARVFCGGIGIKRSKKIHEKYVEKVITEKQRVFGVKGCSPTMLIPLFNIIYSFPPEYMHCVLLGVCKTFATMWFDSKNFQKPWYIGTKVNLYDQKLMKIMPCHEISRTTNSIENFGSWKASQWKHHLLYYSLVCLKDILPLRYYKHWLLLIFSIYTFSKDRFSIQEFNSAKRSLRQFVEDTETLYGKEYMKFNIHLLLHTADSVKQFGALWAWSAFPFEHYNGILTKMFHNSQSVPQQICKSYLRLQNIKNSTVFLQQNCSVSGKSLFNKMLGDYNVDKCLDFGLLKIFGCAQQIELSVVEQHLITEVLGEEIMTNAYTYDRFIYKNILYHCSDSQLKKRHNSTVKTSNNIIDICNILTVTTANSQIKQCVIIGKVFVVLDETLCTHEAISSNSFSTVAMLTMNKLCCLPENLLRKCILIPYIDNKFVIIPIVNLVETD